MNEDKIRKILAKYAKRRDDNELLLEHRKMRYIIESLK